MTAPGLEIHVASRKAARLTRILTACAIVTALLIGAVVGDYACDGKQWSPLGEYPVQRVDSRIPGINGPAVYSDQLLRITGTKCNDSPKPVKVKGKLSWILRSPRVAIVAPVYGSSIRIPGCETTEYENYVPPEVIKITRSVGGRATWAVIGEETPIRENGEDDVSVEWESQNVLVIIR